MAGNRSPEHQTPECGVKCGNSKSIFLLFPFPKTVIILFTAHFQAKKRKYQVIKIIDISA
jgi:hypothetical protein